MNPHAATPDALPGALDEPLLVVVEEEPPERNPSCRSRHWEMLIGSVVVIALSLMFRLDHSGSVEVPLADGLRMPPVCPSRAWYGLSCPGCGLTRSFVAIASGDLAASFAYHRLGWLLASAVVLQLPYRVYELSGPAHPTPERWKGWFGKGLIVALIGNWLLEMFGI